MLYILLVIIGLVSTIEEPNLIFKLFKPKNKLAPPPTPEPVCEDPPDEDYDAPKEFSLKSGALYRLAASEWYLRAFDQATKSTILINLNDINRIKFTEKELEVEDKKEKPKQVFKDFEWTPMIAYEAFPKNRGGHSMHNIGDYILLFGGCFLDFKCFDDLFLLNTRTKIWTNPKMFGNPPTGRTGFGAMVNGAKFYVFGGHTLQGLVNDLYEFDLESRSWNQLMWPGFAPSPRSNHKMVLTNIGGIIFGGYIGETYSNDVYVLDLVNERWGKPSAGGDPPQPRESFGMIFHHGVVYVLGGYGVGSVLGDLYTLNEDLIWEKKNMFGNVPSPRQGVSMAEYDNRIFLTGGCNPKIEECYNDLLALDTKTNHVSTVSAFAKKNLKQVEYAGMVIAGPLLIHFGGCSLFKTCSDSLTAIKLTDEENCPPCRNGGVCRGGHCSCPQGYQGIDCTVTVFCKQNCLHQGFCMSNAYCRCYSGYTGSVCQILIPCPGNCTDVEHGECQLDGKCKCQDGFAGENCDQKDEEPAVVAECDCNGHGECNDETLLCACDEGFSGPDCSIIEGMENADEFKSIWELLKDDDDTPETGTSDLKMRELIANAYKFDQRKEGQVPIFDNDVDKVYYVNEDEDGNRDGYLDDGDEYRHRKSDNNHQNNNDDGQSQHHRHKSQNTLNFNSKQLAAQGLKMILNNTDQSLDPYQLGNTLTAVPPKRKKKNEEPFQLMSLDECKKRCSGHGVCIEHKCYCWYGYTGEQCQASKIKDFYIGVRRKNVIILCCIFFFLGTICGYLIVMVLQKRGVDDEFKNISGIESGVVEDNEGEVQEQIV